MVNGTRLKIYGCWWPYFALDRLLMVHIMPVEAVLQSRQDDAELRTRKVGVGTGEDEALSANP
jgi:hypothetical protein